jgi:hypothetical protein
MTDLIISSPFAPGYSAVTLTFGGDIEGNWVTGNSFREIIPRSKIIREITIDRIGL